MEDTEEGKLSQFLVAANRSRLLTRQTGMKRRCLWRRATDIHERRVPEAPDSPHHYQRGSPPVFSLTSDGKLTAKNAESVVV